MLSNILVELWLFYRNVIELFLNGASQVKIFNELGNANYNRCLISRTIKRYNETGDIENKPKGGRPRRVRKYTTVRKVRQIFARKATLSSESGCQSKNLARISLSDYF